MGEGNPGNQADIMSIEECLRGNRPELDDLPAHGPVGHPSRAHHIERAIDLKVPSGDAASG